MPLAQDFSEDMGRPIDAHRGGNRQKRHGGRVEAEPGDPPSPAADKAPSVESLGLSIFENSPFKLRR